MSEEIVDLYSLSDADKSRNHTRNVQVVQIPHPSTSSSANAGDERSPVPPPKEIRRQKKVFFISVMIPALVFLLFMLFGFTA